MVEARFGSRAPATRRRAEVILARTVRPPGGPGPGSTGAWPRSRPWSSWRRGWSTSTASTTSSPSSPRRAQRRALDAFAGTDLAPLAAARRRLAELERPSWPPSAATPRSGPGRSTCCATRSPRSTAAGLDDPDEERALAAEEARLADLEAHRQAAAGRPGRQLDGGGRGTRAALVAWARRRPRWAAGRPSTPGRPGCAASRPRWPTWRADLRQVVETWEDDPERLAAVQDRRRTLARPAPQVRRAPWPTWSTYGERPASAWPSSRRTRAGRARSKPSWPRPRPAWLGRGGGGSARRSGRP